MKKNILWIAFAILLAGCSDTATKKAITLKGHVEFNDPNFKMEVFRRDGPDKIVIGEFDVDENNNYNYKMNVDEPGVYFLGCKNWETIAFWAEDENITVNFRGLDTAKIKIKNPPYEMIENSGAKNELMNQINYVNYRNYQFMIGISQLAYKTKFLDKKEKNNFLSRAYRLLYDDTDSRIRQLAEQHYDLNSVLFIYRQLKKGKDDKLMSKIENAHKGYEPMEKIMKEKEQSLINAQKMQIGKVAPDFAFPSFADTTKNIGIANYKGKILLIDFWASWCGPCRKEIPNLKKYYEKYKDKGVAFLSVSIDGKKEDWKKALAEENMDWEQVLAPHSGKEIMELYQFSGIPFIILLDKEGKIFGKHLRGEQIDEAISKLLK